VPKPLLVGGLIDKPPFPKQLENIIHAGILTPPGADAVSPTPAIPPEAL